MKTKFITTVFIFIISIIFIGLPAQAHNLWLNPDNFYPSVGSTVDIGIGWGHKFPANRIDQEVKEDRVEDIQALDPDGIKVNLEKVSAELYRLKIEKAGAYLITAGIKSGFFTKTIEGRKWGDKTAVSNPIKCTNFHIHAKTLIIAGGGDNNIDGMAGQPLELIPLANPSDFKIGNLLPFKVVFDGNPLAKITVRATYAGFGEEDIAPHDNSKHENSKYDNSKKGHGHKHYPVETVTDDQGRADLKLDKAGYWMILLSHKPPYPDSAVCDEYMYNMAFTFQVR